MICMMFPGEIAPQRQLFVREAIFGAKIIRYEMKKMKDYSGKFCKILFHKMH